MICLNFGCTCTVVPQASAHGYSHINVDFHCTTLCKPYLGGKVHNIMQISGLTTLFQTVESILGRLPRNVCSPFIHPKKITT